MGGSDVVIYICCCCIAIWDMGADNLQAQTVTILVSSQCLCIGLPLTSIPQAEDPSLSALTSQYDPERTLRFLVYGMAVGPIIGQLAIIPVGRRELTFCKGGWMRILEKGIPIRAGASGNGLQLAKRVAADQFIM